ncbi:hypothetical protein MQX03_02250 [Chryseobacterium aahli]|uniref:hypothetical protein n=1 Tax=Chryseobacterium aahli TaxID=1278643 RepID=UPI001F622A1D|nr:hypothetical protein [Chryseobacterium aahli]MCI3936002.1 hypothetical protein [Chryseobacterium aahli]
MKNLSILFLVFFNLLYSQTPDENLVSDLNKTKLLFLNKRFEAYGDFVYPNVFKISGGREKVINLSRSAVEKMEAEGYIFLDINFKSFSKMIKVKNQLQTSFTQTILMQTPKGKIESDYTMIAISINDGKNWKFIDTSGNDKETMLKLFPELSDKIIVLPKRATMINEIDLDKRCREFNQLKMYTISDIGKTKSIITVSDNELREDYSTGSVIISHLERNEKKPCEISATITKVIGNDSSFKIGYKMKISLIKFDKNEIYYSAEFNNVKSSGKYFVTDNLVK